ncbi:MAG: ATP-binding protein [Chitinophagaceae bacterium]
MIKKIVTIGPESTGKSMLCEQLATHYGTTWCPEYAREYLLKNGTDYSYEDLLTIACGQVELEDKAIGEWSMVNKKQSEDNSNPQKSESAHSPLTIHHLPHSPLATHHTPLFVDTNMYVMKVWCEFVFGNCHRYILDQIVERKYDLYLLCNIDLPWVKDELREYPDLETRRKLYAIYKDILINQSVPWVEISGNYEERFQSAVKAVDQLIMNVKL